MNSLDNDEIRPNIKLQNNRSASAIMSEIFTDETAVVYE